MHILDNETYRIDESDITPALIKNLVDNHFSFRSDRLKQYYDGQQDILIRKFDDKTKPNNKIVTNFCKYISDVSTGNFIGKPVSYSGGEKLMDKLQDIFNYNDEQQVNAKLALSSSIRGASFEILYTVKDGDNIQVRFDELDQDEQRVILVYDRSIEKNLIMAIRYFDYQNALTLENIREIFVYTKDDIKHYENKDAAMTLIDEEDHPFSDVPINVYWNKSENSKGDFEDITTLNDAYNLLQSDDINESNYSNDAYLIIKNMDADKEDLKAMKESRAIKVSEDGEVKWLIKDINDTWKENIKTRIEKDIHKISGVPSMSDENFAGTASGVALKYKLLPFENNRVAKERHFKKSLQRRIELITNVLNKQGNSFDWRDISMTFTPNLPVDISEEIEGVVKLIGTDLASKDTLMNRLSFIEDSAAERIKIDEENEGNIDLDKIGESDEYIKQLIREAVSDNELRQKTNGSE